MNRREVLVSIGSLGAGLILSSCSNASRSVSHGRPLSSPQHTEAKDGEVAATEDLMREHGVLRRALFVYSEVSVKLGSGSLDAVFEGLHKTAVLFRTFGEDYHEKKLEETYIFPAVKKAGSTASVYPDILIAQHNRGRQITDYILAVTAAAKPSQSEQLAMVLESFVRMYRPHAAREDTVVFPAWKQTLTAPQLDEMGEKFEEIEQQQFGADGFENAVRQIAAIESELGLADLSQFTAGPQLASCHVRQARP
jgi:hemerythrin-like domain-containing protein